MSDPFEYPAMVAALDPAILDSIAEQYPGRSAETTWYPPADGRPVSDPALFEVLEPLHDVVLAHETGLFARQPSRIAYDIDTVPVSPGDSQCITTNWHTDGGNNRRNTGLMVASVLPKCVALPPVLIVLPNGICRRTA